MASPRFGVFGGTFDPPHVGHLVAASNAAAQCELTDVLFVVANVPWQKVDDRSISPAQDRLTMTTLAARTRPQFEASAIEIERGGDSVTADTLEQLAAERPDAEPVVIVGSDAAVGLDSWRRARELREMARFAVVDRPGNLGGRPPAGFTYDVIPCPLMDVSSSDIRDRVRRHRPIDFLVPDDVAEFVASRGLYR